MEIYNKLEMKMKILQELNTDDSRFLYRICKSYKSYNDEMERYSHNINIEIDNKKTKIQDRIINLDDIECERYFNTKMKNNIKRMAQDVMNTQDKDFYNNKNTCKNIIYNKNKDIPIYNANNKMDIVELIKILDKNKIGNIKIIANNISSENIFKYQELIKALKIINTDDLTLRNKIIYEYIYEYLNKDFISNKYCDFINDKCVAQRHFNLYPFSKKDGCCFKQIRKCEHLDRGNCNVECMACRLFACPYLTKRGVGYWANEFILLNAFLNKKQRKHLVFDFYKSKDFILDKINNEEKK
jgi:hypothetical protein